MADTSYQLTMTKEEAKVLTNAWAVVCAVLIRSEVRMALSVMKLEKTANEGTLEDLTDKMTKLSDEVK